MRRQPGPRKPPARAVTTVAVSSQRARQILGVLVDHTAGAFEEAARHNAHRFIGRWIAFNAVFKEYFSGSERGSLMACIQNSIPNGVADAVLDSLQPEITFLANLPPGDMRFRGDPRFRVRSTDDMRIVCDISRMPIERLAHLVAVVYQVRCNLFHGEKNPTHLRDHQLIGAGDRILGALLHALV